MHLAARTIEAKIEAWLPLVAAGAATLVTFAYGPRFFRAAVENGWEYSAAYSAIFDIATIFTAFLFTFYSFILTAEGGFIGRMKKTRSYRQAVRYTLQAILLGALLAALSVPMMVWGPCPTAHSDPSLAYVSVWAGLAIWGCAAFVRAAYLFSIFAGAQSG